MLMVIGAVVVLIGVVVGWYTIAGSGIQRRPYGKGDTPGAGRMSPATARAAGASGFVSKDWEAAEIARAVRMVGLGMTMFPPKSEQPAPLLTEREREVLDLIAAGSTNREIAERLYLSPHTVKEHTSALYRKLRARNRAEAVQRAQRIGLLG